MKKYFYLEDAKIQGPYTLEELKQTNPQPSTLIWHKKLHHWMPAKDSKELKKHFGLSPNKLIDLKSIFSRIFFKPSTFNSENMF